MLLNDSKFQANDESTAFIRDVQVGAEPYCVLGTKRQLNDIHRFCCNAIEYRPLTVDPTFNLGPYNVTPISYQHLLVNGKEGNFPTMIGPVFIHEKKTTTTYSMFAATIKSLDPRLTNILAFGTDDETALVEGFNQHFERATHVLCEIHLKKNIETKLVSMGITGEVKKTIVSDIFGRKVEGAFESGLSDAKDSEEFTVMLDSVLEKWSILHPNAEHFHSWFKSNKAKQFSESVISSVRQRAGLGCPPEKFTTNRSERTNGVIQDFIKRECGKDKVDEYTFAKSLEKLIRIQEQELEMAILGKGEYKLRDQYSHILVDPQRWDKMTDNQRKNALSRIHGIGIEDVLPTSVSVASARLSNDLPSVVKDIVSAGIDWISTDVLMKMVFSAEETIKRGNIAELPGTAHETIVVPSKSRPTNPHVLIMFANGKVECRDCPGYSSLSICSHVLVACLKKGHLEKFLKWLIAAKRKTGGINISQAVTYGMPAGRGRKGNKAPRKRQGKQAQSTTTSIITRPGLLSNSPVTNLQMPNLSPCVLPTRSIPDPSNEVQGICQTTGEVHGSPLVARQDLGIYGRNTRPNSASSSTVHVTVPAGKQQQQTAYTRPPHPTPVPGMSVPTPNSASSSTVCVTVPAGQQQQTAYTRPPYPTPVPVMSVPTPNSASSTLHVTVPAGQQQQQTAYTRPPYPTPVPGMFIVYLLHFCPPKTSVCYGCSQTLKPNGVILNQPHDLVIVSNMEREWHDGNMVHKKYSNVYFHCCCECVRKRHCSNFHISIPASMLQFLTPTHKIFLRQTFGLNVA